jgi:hypothetical protein
MFFRRETVKRAMHYWRPQSKGPCFLSTYTHAFFRRAPCFAFACTCFRECRPLSLGFAHQPLHFSYGLI